MHPDYRLPITDYQFTTSHHSHFLLLYFYHAIKKSLALTRTRDSWFHLISCTCHHAHLDRYLLPHTLALYRELPGRPTHFQPAKLRNALHHPIHIRFHYPDSLCWPLRATLFFLVWSCEYFTTGGMHCQEIFLEMVVGNRWSVAPTHLMASSICLLPWRRWPPGRMMPWKE